MACRRQPAIDRDDVGVLLEARRPHEDGGAIERRHVATGHGKPMLIVPPVKTTATRGIGQSRSAGSAGPGGAHAGGGDVAAEAPRDAATRATRADPRRGPPRSDLGMGIGRRARDAGTGLRLRTLATPAMITAMATTSMTVAVPIRSEIGPTMMIGRKLETDTSMLSTPKTRPRTSSGRSSWSWVWDGMATAA